MQAEYDLFKRAIDTAARVQTIAVEQGPDLPILAKVVMDTVRITVFQQRRNDLTTLDVAMAVLALATEAERRRLGPETLARGSAEWGRRWQKWAKAYEDKEDKVILQRVEDVNASVDNAPLFFVVLAWIVRVNVGSAAARRGLSVTQAELGQMVETLYRKTVGMENETLAKGIDAAIEELQKMSGRLRDEDRKLTSDQLEQEHGEILKP